MNKVFVIALVMILAVSMVPLGCAEQLNGNADGGNVTPPVGQNIELDFVTFFPAWQFQAAIGHVNWMKTLEDRVATETAHTLKINLHYGAHGKIPAQVQDGTYDIGVFGVAVASDMLPLWRGLEYPGGLYRNNALTMSMAAQALYDEFTALQDEMAAQNLKVMHFWSSGPWYFFMTPGNEVRTLADFPGKTIRVSCLWHEPCIQALRADALFVALSQAIEKFQAGLIDGILCPGDLPGRYMLGAHVKHSTFAPFSYQFVFAKVMNEDTWNALPPEVQAIFDEVNAAWPEYYGKLRAWGEAKGLQFCYGVVPGFTCYDLPKEDPTEYAAWVATTEHLVKEWIGENATRHVLWHKFVELDEYYATTEPWSTWAPDGRPPAVPTFP